MGLSAKRVLFLLWPPAELIYVNRCAEPGTGRGDPERWELRFKQARRDVEESLAGCSDQDSVVAEAEHVYESEQRRRVEIEDKAASYGIALGVSVALLSALPLLNSSGWLAGGWVFALPSTVYVLGVVHLLCAVYYSVRVRQVTALALPSVGQSLEQLRSGGAPELNRAVTQLTRAEFNEPLIRRKSNYLSVAESMFLRGIVLVGLAAAATLVIPFLVDVASTAGAVRMIVL